MFIINLIKRIIDSTEVIKYIAYILYATIFILTEQNNIKNIMILIITISVIMIILIAVGKMRAYIAYFKDILRGAGGICISRQINYPNNINRFLVVYSAIELSYNIIPMILMIITICIFIAHKCCPPKIVNKSKNISKNKINGMNIIIDTEIIEMKDKNCLICLENFNNDEFVTLLKCKHIFHTKCIGKWIDRDQTTCPLCRGNINLV